VNSTIATSFVGLIGGLVVLVASPPGEMPLADPIECWPEYWACHYEAAAAELACEEAAGCPAEYAAFACEPQRKNCVRAYHRPSVAYRKSLLRKCLEGPGTPAKWVRTTMFMTDPGQMLYPESWVIVEQGGGLDGPLRPECLRWDRDGDGDVDLADYSRRLSFWVCD
jgi:hypothetical protein